MARSFYGIMMQAARAAERTRRKAVRDHERAVRQAERDRKTLGREHLRQARVAEREAKLNYLASREEETADLNAQVAERIEELRSILLLAPDSARPIDLASLKKRFVPQHFNAEAIVGQCPEPPRKGAFAITIAPPGFFSKLFGGQKKYDAAVEAAEASTEADFQLAMTKFERVLAGWQQKENIARAQFEEKEITRKAEVTEHNEAVQSFVDRYQAGEQEAVREYFSMVLDRSTLLEDFPETFRLAFSPDSQQIIVEHALPTLDIVPPVSEYTYVRSKDEIRGKPRKKAEIKEIYENLIAGTSLRIINEIFLTDSAGTAQVVVFNGIVQTTSPSTGEPIRPCIVSVRVTRGDFSKILLKRVDPVACIKSLGSVSKRPDDLAPVRPIIEFDMADPRFIAESDILSGLESRPNIMDLKPSEFESLVTNLFTGMGLDAKQTRASRDGGVDAVAFDSRPVLGGKIVIQAKRYKNTVGVAAVRDLFGTMINEGANKGILVTTAGYGPDAFEFAKDKPIELIDGPGLLYLLEQQGVEARIVMPVE